MKEEIRKNLEAAGYKIITVDLNNLPDKSDVVTLGNIGQAGGIP